MIKPMPKEMLIHSVTYEEFYENRHGQGFKDPIELKHVLIQPVSSIKRSNLSDEVSYNSLLFFDCVNSRPSDITFKKKSRIKFNGESMVVDKVNPIYTFNLHHYELELI